MKIINYEDLIKDKELKKYESVLTIGKFLSLHQGHKKILEEISKFDKNLKRIIITFENMETFKGIKRINRQEAIYEYLETNNIDYIIKIDILKHWNIEPQEFLKYINENLKIKKIIVGKSFKYGKNAKGNIFTLNEFFPKEIINVLDLEKKNNAIISSTLLRELIAEGSIEMANELLLIPYIYEGVTIRGNGKGREFGMRTINTDFPEKTFAIPKDGVYFSIGIYKNKRYYALTSIGKKPTFEKNIKRFYETHFINFDKEIYGETIEVELITFVREQKKYNTIDELIEALNKDKSQAVEFFLNNYK